MKEQVILSYSKGISHSPSGMICDDGELEECVNLEVKNGELVPMEMPVRLPFSLDEGERLLLIHNTKTADKHYITLNGSTLAAFSVENGVKYPFEFSYVISGNVTSVCSVGNTIVVYTEEDVYYFLYIDNDYKFLGNSLPEINVAFKLSGEDLYSEETELTVSGADVENNGGEDFVEATGIVSKFVNEQATSKGKFVYPFFVRYALRMFDGSNVLHSAPILMNPCTNRMPILFWDNNSYAYKSGTFKAKVGMIASKLMMDIFDASDIENWKDIITGVDVYVSSPISTYDINKTEYFGTRTGSSDRDVRTNIYTGIRNGEYARWNVDSVIKVEGFKETNYGLRSFADIDSDIISASLFYKFYFISTDSIKSDETITIDGKLENLETNETLTDDYLSHTRLTAKTAFVYNSRLNISDISRIPFNGFPLHSMCNLPYNNGNSVNNKYVIYTYIHRSDGSTDVVKSEESELLTLQGLSYLFYPDTDAYKMVIHSTTSRNYYIVNLSEHQFLNGAYALFEFKNHNSGALDITESIKPERLYNRLLLSNVNNPFHFPLEGYYTVGSDKIIGVAAVTRPISQGQFGEFPLIVFCSDGNYAMRVDEQGYYSSISPIQEDVVLGSDKITAMENSVVIVTKRGLMLTTGGEMVKIAENMEGGISDILSLGGVSSSKEDVKAIVESGVDIEGFLSYAYGSRMAFDYSSNRLFVYNPEKTYSYVYHFDNDTTSKMVIGNGARIVTSVLDYPDTIIQDENGGLYSLYSKDDASQSEDRQIGFMLTRPLKMGAPLSLKTITQLSHISSNLKGDSYIKYALYGSNDDVKYIRVSSRHGKPYKYYRMAIYSNLLPKESLSGAVMMIEKRRENKFR